MRILRKLRQVHRGNRIGDYSPWSMISMFFWKYYQKADRNIYGMPGWIFITIFVWLFLWLAACAYNIRDGQKAEHSFRMLGAFGAWMGFFFPPWYIRPEHVAAHEERARQGEEEEDQGEAAEKKDEEEG